MRAVVVVASGLCRLTRTPLEVVLDLGRQPLGNGFIDPNEAQDEYFYHLRCGFSEESMLFQLIDQPAPELMFHEDYAFVSGTSQLMQQHFEEFATGVLDGQFCSTSSFVVELGCNDGILLHHFANKGIKHLGVEPSSTVGQMAADRGVNVTNEFFSETTAKRVRDEHGPADVVMAANVMCHIPDINDLAVGIAGLLSDDGVLIFEDPYLGAVIELGSYDQIYDEHVFLFSALSVQRIFARVGMELIDAEAQSTHGGSMRYTLAKIGRRPTAPWVAKVLEREAELGLDRLETFRAFAKRVDQNRRELKSLLTSIKAEGREIVAFGATSKSTTIYNYAGIGPDLISRIYDNTPQKIGKLSPGMHIPIISTAQFAEDGADDAFLAAWNHEREVLSRNDAFVEAGGRWISHVPNVRFL